jgi:hypothetical protein
VEKPRQKIREVHIIAVDLFQTTDAVVHQGRHQDAVDGDAVPEGEDLLLRAFGRYDKIA